MFAVEQRISDDDSIAEAMTRMREWLDHQHVEPTVFRYMFGSPGVLLHVDFSVQDEAIKFADAFGGQLVSISATPAPARQFLDSPADG